MSRRFCYVQGRDMQVGAYLFSREVPFFHAFTQNSGQFLLFRVIYFSFFAFARSSCIRSLSTISEPRFSISFSYSRIVCRMWSILSSCCRSKTLSRSSINGTSPCQIARIYRNFRSFSRYRSLALHRHTNPVAESPNRSASQTQPFTNRLSIS